MRRSAGGARGRLSATLLLAMACSQAWAGERPAPCAPPGNEATELHVHAKSNQAQDLRRLAARLGRDGFEVLFTEDGSEGLSPLVSVRAAPSLFRRVFGVRLENAAMPRSARNGFYCQLRVVRSAIPMRYRALVEGIQAPDPQLY